MKLFLPLAFGLILSLSALSSNTLKTAETKTKISQAEIDRQVEELYKRKDLFVEKGNFLPHLQVHH